jgi:hypothetical protein
MKEKCYDDIIYICEQLVNDFINDFKNIDD